MEYFLELFLGGMTRGSIYALIALGYTMVYGIIELINFAHGEIYMIGAFTALIIASVLNMLGWNVIAILVIASAGAVIYSSAYGYTVEKLAYKPLRRASASFCSYQRHRHVVFSTELCAFGSDFGLSAFSESNSGF